MPLTSLPICLNLSRLAFQLGGPGLVALGLLDNSFIPTPAAQDFVTAVLSAGDPEWWFYYAVMATIGAILGGSLTFRLGRKGGEAAMEGRISKRKVETVTRRFREWGWGAVFLPAILPPPFPAPPFFFTAGALKYPFKKFLALIAVGRSLRYLAVAYLAFRSPDSDRFARQRHSPPYQRGGGRRRGAGLYLLVRAKETAWPNRSDSRGSGSGQGHFPGFAPVFAARRSIFNTLRP